uniref:Uncharacterized protein n=1 Tax=Ornithodoros turicata TaxID=34597 RepID=A0A2R5L574_9ACAR
MAQGKLKVKASVPKNSKNARNRTSLRGVTKARSAPKKAKAVTAKQQVQVALEKNIRKNIEQELRARAGGEGKPFGTTAGTSQEKPKKRRKR